MEKVKRMERKNDQAIKNDSDLLELFELEQWSNAACRGYAIKACESVGLDHETVVKVIKAFRWTFEEYTVKQAEQIYYDF